MKFSNIVLVSGPNSRVVLLFGGSGYTRTGQGEIAERIYREVMGVR